MRKVALFGGAFDPVTLAHQMVCQKIHEETGCEIWLLPCWEHKFGKQPTPAYHRWAMLSLMCINNPYINLCSWEIDAQHTGSMYETIHGVKCSFPDVAFHLVIGMDNANVIKEKWDRGDQLVSQNPFLVVTRKNENSTTNWYNEPPHRLLEVDSGISSTIIRDAVANQKFDDAAKMVTKNVWDYIVKNSLYGLKK